MQIEVYWKNTDALGYNAALKIQTLYRGYMNRKKSRKKDTLSGIVKVQSILRKAYSKDILADTQTISAKSAEILENLKWIRVKELWWKQKHAWKVLQKKHSEKNLRNHTLCITKYDTELTGDKENPLPCELNIEEQTHLQIIPQHNNNVLQPSINRHSNTRHKKKKNKVPLVRNPRTLRENQEKPEHRRNLKSATAHASSNRGESRVISIKSRQTLKSLTIQNAPSEDTKQRKRREFISDALRPPKLQKEPAPEESLALFNIKHEQDLMSKDLDVPREHVPGPFIKQMAYQFKEALPDLFHLVEKYRRPKVFPVKAAQTRGIISLNL